MNNIQIIIPKKEEIKDIIAINTDYFSQAETTSKALNVPKKLYRNYAEHITTKAFKSGQILIAKTNEKVIGYILWEDYFEPLVIGIKTNPEVYKMIAPELAFVEKLEATLKSEYSFKNSECARLMQAAVMPEEQNKGIATLLVDEAIKNIEQRNYKYIIADCTADNSWRILKKFDFRIVSEIEYSEFEYEGYNPFKMLDGSRRLVIKVL